MKQKAETYKKKRIVMGDENLVTNSEIHIKDVVKDLYGDSSGDNENNYKYYNRLLMMTQDPSLMFANKIKTLDGDGKTNISPTVTALSSKIIAIEINLGEKYYTNEQWMTVEEFFGVMGMPPIQGKEITREEFYHIPEDDWVSYGQSEEDAKNIFEFLYPKVKEYEYLGTQDDYFGDLTALYLPLSTWVKSNNLVFPNGHVEEGVILWGIYRRNKNAPFLGLYNTDYTLDYILPDEIASEALFEGLAFQNVNENFSWAVGKYTFPDGSTRYGYWQLVG
jgi:hypothetical protein